MWGLVVAARVCGRRRASFGECRCLRSDRRPCLLILNLLPGSDGCVASTDVLFSVSTVGHLACSRPLVYCTLGPNLPRTMIDLRVPRPPRVTAITDYAAFAVCDCLGKISRTWRLCMRKSVDWWMSVDWLNPSCTGLEAGTSCVRRFKDCGDTRPVDLLVRRRHSLGRARLLVPL
jgi:hypothetical protein